MNANEKLRQDRLIFYQQDVERIDRILAEFLRLSGARCALLVDKEGHAVTSQGDLRQVNMDTISALVAGSFAATREMARLLGEQQFSALFHQGQSDNIQLSLVGDRTLLTVLFDDKTTVGMVRLYASECGRKLEEVFKDTLSRKGAADNPTLQAGYGASAKDRLASLFGMPEK